MLHSTVVSTCLRTLYFALSIILFRNFPHSIDSYKIYVVILESRQFVIIRNDDWIQNKNIGIKTKIFYSPNENSQSNFNAQQKYLHDKHADSVYDGYVSKIFGKFHLYIAIKLKKKSYRHFNFIIKIGSKVILLLHKNT